MNPLVRIRREQILRMLDGFRIQLPTGFGLLEVEADVDTEWQPLHRIAVTGAIKRHHERNSLPAPDAIWRNDTYEVMVYNQGAEGAMHLSIKRYDRAAVHNWRHFQQIKNEIAGEFVEGIELYPSEARLADNANQYHVWTLPEGVEFPVGFPNGMVVRDDEDVTAWNTMGHSGRQEPFQPGVTVGAQMNEAQKETGVRPKDAMDAYGPTLK